jgi:ABC-type multidrug transport system fused ATPase/permease subunit
VIRALKKLTIICVLAVLICILPIYATNSSSNQTQSDYQLGHGKIKNLENSTYQQIQDLQEKILHIIEQIRLIRIENAHLIEVQELKTELINLESQMQNLIEV